jgi:UDP-glucose 4-epimerase
MVKATQGTEVVYHCAANPHEGLSVFSPVTVTNSVFASTVTTMTAAIVNDVRRFVNFSSMARYGSIAVPYRETQAPEPEDPYGVAKVAAEKEVALLSKIHGMEYVTAVPHNVVGPGQRYDDPYRNVVAIMINRCLQGKPPIIYGHGEQKRCFSHVKDSLQALMKMATASNVVGEVINIGPDEEFVTINDLAARVIKATEFEGEPLYVPGRPQEVQLAYCSSDKSRRLLDYKTTRTLDEIICEMVEWISLRGPLPFDYYLTIEINNEKTPRTWKERLL